MADELRRRLGLTVQAARRRTALTQERLAELIGRTPESVSNIERGLQLPTIETLVDLGRALHVPVVDFLHDVDATPDIARERLQMEAQLRELARGLTDRDLRLAIALTRAMADGG